MTAIGAEQRLAAQEPAKHRQDSFENRQAEADNRNSYSHDRGTLTRAGQRKRAEHEADE